MSKNVERRGRLDWRVNYVTKFREKENKLLEHWELYKGILRIDKAVHSDLVIMLIEKIGKITNIGAKKELGNDLCGDLGDYCFRRMLSAKKHNLIFCNNVLTHVRNPDFCFEIINSCLADNVFVIIIAPYQYPYRANLYDSMYRPSVADIETKLSPFEPIASNRFKSSKTQLTRLMVNKRLPASFLLNITFPRRGLDIWKNKAIDLVSQNKRFSRIGVVMKNEKSEKIYCKP